MNELRRLRMNANLTVAGLADVSGVPAPTIHRLERGETLNPQLKTITAIADTLGVPAGDLVAALQQQARAEEVTATQ